MADRDIRHLLADRLRETARWREEKADEYPEDDRNAQSVRALAKLADDVERLSSVEVPELLVLDSAGWSDDGVYVPSEASSRLISR